MPRIVRRSNSSYSALILDALLELSENLSLVDWDALSKRVIVPVGVGVNLIYWLICLQLSHLHKTANNAVFDSGNMNQSRNGRSKGHWWGRTLWTISVVFMFCSVANTWFCFSRRREYYLQRKEGSRPASDSSSNPSTPKRNNIGSSGSLGWDLLGRLSPALGSRRSTAARPSTPDKIVAWDPSLPSLRLFSVFSPVHVLINYKFAQSAMSLLIILLVSVQTLYLVHLYDLHVSHKRVIYGQVFSDYEKNFVQPRIGVMKRDVGVGTRPDDNGVYVEVHTPKFGIIDASKARSGIPRSASQIKMHDWERPVDGHGSPNVWAIQSPIKPNPLPLHQHKSVRRSIASPMKINGSPAKMYKPAGWGTGPQYQSSGNLFTGQENESQQRQNSGLRRSKTTTSLVNPWE